MARLTRTQETASLTILQRFERHALAAIDRALAMHLDRAAEARRVQDQPMPIAPAILRARRARDRFLPADLFGEPGWDMLLALYVSQARGQVVSTTSLCYASAVPATTALRWIGKLVDAGVFIREGDFDDRRRTFVRLAPVTAAGLDAYFGWLGTQVKAPQP